MGAAIEKGWLPMLRLVFISEELPGKGPGDIRKIQDTKKIRGLLSKRICNNTSVEVDSMYNRKAGATV